MPDYQSIVDIVTSPAFAPVCVIVAAVMFLLLARARKRARHHLKRASEIEGRLRD